MKKITVLGCGMVGSAIAVDLSKDYTVLSVDRDSHRLASLKNFPNITTAQKDLRDKKAVQSIISDADLVIGAVPGFMGYETVKTALEAGKNVVDISFFPEEPFPLDPIARKNKVTAIVDCGVAPGMGNIILGYHNAKMEIEEYRCYVGGLPFKRVYPFSYKAPFSPIDVIEEYTRPARIKINGEIITKQALSDPELIDFDPVGTLEAFTTDGLRSLLRTMKIPTMIEKTMRYPGHRDLMVFLRDAGFFSEEPLALDGSSFRPLDFTAKILTSQWKSEPDELEFTAMLIFIKGTENGKRKEYLYNLYDTFDAETKTSSMARTTGYTCTAAARFLLNGNKLKKGLITPEQFGADEKAFSFVIKELEDRGIHYHCTVREETKKRKK